MARPVYQYRPFKDDDQKIGILLPFNKGAAGRPNALNYASSSAGGNGVFVSSTTTEEQAISNLKNLILTEKGERYMQPNFGTHIREVLFENNTNDLRDRLQDTIEEDIEYWLPYVKLKNVELESSNDNHTLSIRLFFRIETVGANVVINILADENAFQVSEIAGDELVQIGTFGSDTAFGAGQGGAY